MSYTGAWERLWGAIVPGPKGGLWVMLSPALDPSGQGSLAQVRRFFFFKSSCIQNIHSPVEIPSDATKIVERMDACAHRAFLENTTYVRVVHHPSFSLKVLHRFWMHNRNIFVWKFYLR